MPSIKGYEYSSLFSSNICDVQPMNDMPKGTVFYMDFKTKSKDDGK